MTDTHVKIDLVKFIQQVLPQIPGVKDRELLLNWLDRNATQKRIVEIDLDRLQPQEPRPDEFCPRCGYETVVVRKKVACCQTCGLSWAIES